MTDITRLPKWAQDRICIAERTVEELKAALEIAEGKHGLSNASVRHRADDLLFVPDHASFRMQLGERYDRYIEANIGNGGDCVKIYAGTSLLIEPESSNVVTLRLRQR
jgi:hypothetical protein